MKLKDMHWTLCTSPNEELAIEIRFDNTAAHRCEQRCQCKWGHHEMVLAHHNTLGAAVSQTRQVCTELHWTVSVSGSGQNWRLYHRIRSRMPWMCVPVQFYHDPLGVGWQLCDSKMQNREHTWLQQCTHRWQLAPIPSACYIRSKRYQDREASFVHQLLRNTGKPWTDHWWYWHQRCI